MKLAVKTSQVVNSVEDLKNINSSTVSLHDIKFVVDSVYKYYTHASEGIKPNNLGSNDLGRWIDISHKRQDHVFKVEDDHDFAGNGDTDISSVHNFTKYKRLFINEMRVKVIIEDYVTNNGGFNSLTNEEKDIFINYFCDEVLDPDFSTSRNLNNNNKVGYLMGVKGMTLAEASVYLNDVHTVFSTTIEIPACKSATGSQDILDIVKKYLNEADATDFLNRLSDLLPKYSERAIKGLNYGMYGIGPMDFIESTPGTNYETMGLAQQLYVYKTGDVNEFKDKLKEILIKHKYEK